MPQSEVIQEDPHKLPENTYFPAKLIHVTEKAYPYVVKKGERAGQKDTFKKWEWEFEIVGGDFQGLHAWGDTEAKITVTPNGERNVAAQWIEALRDLEVSFGEGINTDDYDGLPCVITVRHDARDKNDGSGSKWYSEPVKDVFPERVLNEVAHAAAGLPEEPPF